MREPPVDLSDGTLAGALRAHYGLAVTAVTFLPLGHDSSAWVYRVQTAGEATYFLKVRTSVTNAPSLLVPRYLHEHGVAQVVAPLPTAAGALWAAAPGYALILYPFITGTTGMAEGMAEAQWRAYGAILRQVHSMEVAPDLALLMRRESFVPTGAATVREVDGHIGRCSHTDPVAHDLATLWRERRDTIHALAARAEELGKQLAHRSLPFVLCHADIHTDNVLLDAEGAVWIVDWDETVLAPRERDLMFAVGGGISRSLVGLREEEWFLTGYGPTTLDPLALSYYRYAWAVSDIGEYGAQIVAQPDLGEISQRAALNIFLSLFKPSEIVDLALASDEEAAPILSPRRRLR